MGLFSKCCAKTHLPVLYDQRDVRRLAPHLTDIVVLLRNGEVYDATYDGYGLGLVGSGHWDDAKLVLKRAYAGETYDQLPTSEHEPQQGFFFSLEEIEALARIPAFPTHSAYEDFLDETQRISEELHEELLRAAGAPATVPWYKTTNCFAAVQDCLEVPGMSLHVERYAQRRMETPELAAFMPADPADAAQMVQQFFTELSARTRTAYGELVDRVLASQQQVQPAP